MTLVSPGECPTPEYHETHRYCPSCTWVYEEPDLEARAEAAFLAECGDYGVAWGDLPEWKRESWRCELDPGRDPRQVLRLAARAKPCNVRCPYCGDQQQDGQCPTCGARGGLPK